jgi:hypothetical protein
MGNGADGIFLDNLLARQPCFGARLGIHPHIFPDPADPNNPSAQNQAFASLLHCVHEVIKKHKPDGRVLGNSGDPLNVPLEFQQFIASDMLEAYICQCVSAFEREGELPGRPDSGMDPCRFRNLDSSVPMM